MQIFKELIIKPQLVVVPLNSKQHKIKFVAEGGDGNYQWSSSNTNLVYISQNGIAETKTEFINFENSHHHQKYNEYSDTIISDHNSKTKLNTSSLIHVYAKVALKRNMKISRTAEILFLNPIKLEIVKYNFETALHDYINIHIALYANINDTLVPFTLCENLNFDLEFTDPIFEIIEKPSDKSTINDRETLASNACYLIKIRAINIGTTYLRISYTTNTNKLLADEISLNVFEKLQILNPSSNEIILPIGSSRNLIYINGPQKLYNIDSDLIKILENDKSIVEITQENSIKMTSSSSSSKSISITQKAKSIYVFTVLCKKVGETKLKFQIFNSLSSDIKNVVPYISEFITNIHCVKPRFLRLYATEKLRPGCPLEIRNSLIHLKNDKSRNIEVEIEVLDYKNRKLMNITSLVIDWQFMKNNEKLQKNIICYRDTEEELIENIKIPHKDYLICSLADITPNFKIKGIITEYDANILKSFNIKPEIPNFAVQKVKYTYIYKIYKI